MRAFNIGLVVIGVLFGITGASHKMVIAGTANFEAHDAVIYGLHIALPDSMKAFPAELVPLP